MGVNLIYDCLFMTGCVYNTSTFMYIEWDYVYSKAFIYDE